MNKIYHNLTLESNAKNTKYVPFDLDYIDNPVIIMRGYPASGKSSFAKSLSDKYRVICQDIYKTLSKTK